MPSNLNNLPKLNGISKASDLPEITNIPILQQARIFVLAEQTPGTKTFGTFPATSFSDLVFADQRFEDLLGLINTSGVVFDLTDISTSLPDGITLVSAEGNVMNLLAHKGVALPSCTIEFDINNRNLTDITLSVGTLGSAELPDNTTSVDIATYINQYQAYNQDSITIRIDGKADTSLSFNLIINIEFKFTVYFGMSTNTTLTEDDIITKTSVKFYNADSLASGRYFVKDTGSGTIPFIAIPQVSIESERLQNLVMLVNNMVATYTTQTLTNYTVFYSDQAILNNGVLLELINPNEEN